MEDLLLEIAKIGPVFTLLIIAIWYFLSREKKKDKEIEKLNLQLRESDRDNLAVLLKVAALIDKVLDTEKTNNELLIKDIETLLLKNPKKND